MLRNILRNFLDELTEREFDAPMMAMLEAQGFADIHLIHGVFEFGKDVIAKRRDPITGVMEQFAIQSKAGDLGLPEWRAVRPQLEEAVYNTRAHPNFDEALPRVAVLATTGKLKGAAPVDAQEFRDSLRRRELGADLVVWDQESFLAWLSPNPGVASTGSDDDFESAVLGIRRHQFSEADLERFTRRWCGGTVPSAAALEAAVLAQAFRSADRLDMAALTALHLLRAAVVVGPTAQQRKNSAAQGKKRDARPAAKSTASASSPLREPGLRESALHLFEGYVGDLLAQVEPLLDDPKALAWATADPMAMVTYPAVACRLTELFALCALCALGRDDPSNDDPSVSEPVDTDGEPVDADGDEPVPEAAPDEWSSRREHLHRTARRAVVQLTATHPGSKRPISDRYAVSVIAPAIVLANTDRASARDYLRAVSKWLLSRHDEGAGRLGIGSLDESDEVVAGRLLGAALESTTLTPRKSSYLATVLLDLLAVLGEQELYGAVRRNCAALRIIACGTSADETVAGWRRFGGSVQPEPRIEFSPEPAFTALVRPKASSLDAVLLASVCRSRHDSESIAALIGAVEP